MVLAVAQIGVGSIPALLWYWFAFAVAIASGFGFLAGYLSAQYNEKRAYVRARSGLDQLFATVLSMLVESRKACALLEKYPEQALAPIQTERLEKERTGLLEAITRLIQRNRPQPASAEEGAAPPPAPEKTKINWLLNPADPVTGLPAKSAFESNLASLLELGRKSQESSSLLLVRIDKLDALRQRFGGGADKLVKKLTGVACRALRDEDLVGQYSADMLGVLLPGLDLEEGAKLAKSVRDSIRNYHFRIDEEGPEVLLTASFGFTPCLPTDNIELVLNRAVDALSKSQRLGRNHLHIHDGETVAHSAATPVPVG